MIIKVTKAEQLPICLDIIHKSFQTVAEDLHLTRENCPGHTAFMPPEKLRAAFDGLGVLCFCADIKTRLQAVFLCTPQRTAQRWIIWRFYRLTDTWGSAKTGGLCRRLCKGPLGSTKIQIGIVEENTVLKAWYQSQGFIHTGTKTFDHLPFTVGFMELKF